MFACILSLSLSLSLCICAFWRLPCCICSTIFWIGRSYTAGGVLTITAFDSCEVRKLASGTARVFELASAPQRPSRQINHMPLTNSKGAGSKCLTSSNKKLLGTLQSETMRSALSEREQRVWPTVHWAFGSYQEMCCRLS